MPFKRWNCGANPLIFKKFIAFSKMKKRHILTTTFLTCLFSIASAQVRIGVKGGLNMANVAFSDDYTTVLEEEIFGSEMKQSMVPSFLLGAQAEFGFGPRLGLGIGLQVSGKGYQYEFNTQVNGDRFYYSQKTNPLYLQMPVTLNFHASGFFASAGPYIGLGVLGAYNLESVSQGKKSSETDSLKFTDDVADDDDNPSINYSPLDYGAGLELGCEFGDVRVAASYQHGLSNIFSKELVDLSKKNSGFDLNGAHRVLGLAVTYFFGGQ